METPPRNNKRVAKCPRAPSKAKRERETSLDEIYKCIKHNEDILENLADELINHEISIMILRHEVLKLVNSFN